MKEKKHAFILYNYNAFNNDLEYIKEYYTAKEIQAEYKLKNKKSIYNYIFNNMEDALKVNNKLFNKYIIIKEDI